MAVKDALILAAVKRAKAGDKTALAHISKALMSRLSVIVGNRVEQQKKDKAQARANKIDDDMGALRAGMIDLLVAFDSNNALMSKAIVSTKTQAKAQLDESNLKVADMVTAISERVNG